MNRQDAKDAKISIALQTDKTPAEYAALAQLIDGYDFDVVSVYCDAPFQPSHAALLLMAPHLKRARMGPAAISPARVHPIDIASQTALLAQMAPGRVYVGVTRGAWLGEHGVGQVKRPIQMIREAVDVVCYLLEGKTGGYEGEFFRLAAHVRAPYALPAERVPILIGAWGRGLCGLAGEIADEVKVGGTANPDLIPVIRGYIGNDRVGICAGAVTVIDEDRELARAAARKAVAMYLPVVAPLDPTVSIEPAFVDRVRKAVERGDEAQAAGMISDDLLDRFAFAGNAADIVRQAERLFAAGASRIEFGTPHGLLSAQGIRMLGQRVIPALRRGR